MTSRANNDVLARRLLDNEADGKESPEQLAAAGERIYLRLREHLAVLLGSVGFDALWKRAVHMAQPKLRSQNDTATDESFPTQASSVYGLHAAVSGRDSATIQHNLVVVFTSFITLLFTFIGEGLGFHFIRQIWPDLPPDAAALRLEEATQ